MICEQCNAATTSDEACYLMASIVCGECFLAENGGTFESDGEVIEL